MSNPVRTAVVVVCGLFIGGLGAMGVPSQAYAQGWVAVAADAKGTLGLRVRGADLGAGAGRIPEGLRCARMRYSGDGAGSLPRLCREPRGRILVWRRPRCQAERGSRHGPARMWAGSAGANVQSRESAVRVIDRNVGAGGAPLPAGRRGGGL
jgi:hypothetical protein